MSRPRSLLAHALPALGLSLLGPIGCGADTPPTSSAATAEQRDVVVEPEDQAGTDRAASEQRTVEGAVVDDPRGETTGGAITVTSPTTSAATPVASLTLVRLLDVDAEDGRGTSARAARAIAFDLDAHLLPPRARDPVLLVGGLALRHYSHPRVGTLRFVLDEGALPADGTSVAAQYGEDDRSRVALGVIDRARVTEAP
jgi:hypothetical protein